MPLGLKFLLTLNGKLFDFKKSSFRYYGFSVAVNILQRWVETEITVHTL